MATPEKVLITDGREIGVAQRSGQAPVLLEFPAWLAKFEPQIPLTPLVEQINNIYHSFDATIYDREHPEIHELLPSIWAEMISILPPRTGWRVLDFGCGTGFESIQLLRALSDRVRKLVCYDPSKEMLGQCRSQLRGVPAALFSSRFEELENLGPFDLLLTNSLLHHLPEIRRTMDSLLPILTSDSIWLAGHEPSARFYRNDRCVRFLGQFAQHHKWSRFFKGKSYISKLRNTFRPNPVHATAEAAFRRGLFKKKPSSLIIDRIVDFHVPHSVDEVADGRGFDFEQMRVDFAKDWQLSWVKTYSFLGPFKPSDAPKRWLRRSHELAERYPNDGANFCAVWFRGRFKIESQTA
jgi:SAM-dependent methyltransferase